MAPPPRSHAYWMSLDIANHTQEPLTIKNLKLVSGQLYKDDDKYHTIPLSDVEGKTVGGVQNLKISTCAQETGDKGIEGSLDIYSGTVLITKVAWHIARIGAPDKRFNTDRAPPGWQCLPVGSGLQGVVGTLGDVTLQISKPEDLPPW